MAIVPSSGTNIRLLSGIPFSNDYKNTRWFDTPTEQLNYFNSKELIHSMTEANFQRIEGRTFIAVDKSIDELISINYLRFQNAQYNPKYFYAFVTKLEYVQRHMTYVHFQIDVFQTWKFNMNFKPSFVIREHCPLWNTDGSPVINTVDEGLNYGVDYDTVAVDNYRPYDGIYFMVIITKSRMHVFNGAENEIVPVLNGVPQPLSYYIHPFKMNGDAVNVNIGGSNINASPILDVIRGVSTHDDAVNNVVSMYITDYVGTNATYDVGTNTMMFSGIAFNIATVSFNGAGGAENVNTVSVDRLVAYSNTDKVYPNKYSGYNSVSESKLLMHPYTVLVLDDLKGNRTTLKNEYILGDDIGITIRGSLGTSNKTAYSVLDYLVGTNLDYSDTLSASLEHSVINNNPSDIPIVTDMLSAYLQGNRNSLENQKASILFNGMMNVAGGAVGGVASASSPVGTATGLASAGVGMVQGAGNTVLQLQALEAKKSDISNTPPQLAKMGNNTNFDYGNGITGLYIIKKQIKVEYRNKLTHFFRMFGYKLNEVKVPNFHTRASWNYVQTSSCNITGNFNNEDLNELKSVFDNGITFWHTDDVGNYALGNEVL